MLSKNEFKDVFDVHFDAIRSFVFYRCGDMDVASDVAQDVFMKIWEKRDALNGSRITPLLYKMATDCYISHYRKGLCRTNFEQSLTGDDGGDVSPEDELLFRETAAVYAKALEQMPEMQRTVFLMNREDEMKYREIAERLHISVKTVEKHISAALRFLKTKLL
jgi:RNA polymerase sigma-70 factor (ECF subfamily)